MRRAASLAIASANPLFNPTFCGEMVGDVFFLNAAGEPNVEADCEIPAGTWLVASPGGSLGPDNLDGEPFTATLHITVEPRHR